MPKKTEEEGWPAKGAKRKKGRAKTGQTIHEEDTWSLTTSKAQVILLLNHGAAREGLICTRLKGKKPEGKTSENFSEESNLPRRFRRYPEIL